VIPNEPTTKPWQVANNLELITYNYKGHSYQAFAEIKSSGYREISQITLEFFSHELQKVDTSDPYSIKAFSEKYGFTFSPMYPSKIRSLMNRSKGKIFLSLAKYLFPVENYSDPVLAIGHEVAKFKNPLGSESCNIDEYYSDGRIPTHKLASSEFARETLGRNSKYGAIIGIDELAITIRQVQVATSIISAYEAGLRDDELVEYLFKSPIVQHSIPDGLVKDAFYGDVFENGLPKTSNEVFVMKKNSATKNPEYYAQMQKVYLSLQFDQLYDAANVFIRKSLSAFNMQNEGISLDPTIKSAPLALKVDIPLNEGSLLEAILTNFAFVRSSKQDWHRCKYSNCQRVFKYHKEYDPSKRFRQAEYCKQSCRVMDANS
jgi:hypothetical protein